MYGSSKLTFTFMSQLLTVGLGTFIINGTVVAYEISQGKIIGYCYQSTKLWLGIR